MCEAEWYSYDVFTKCEAKMFGFFLINENIIMCLILAEVVRLSRTPPSTVQERRVGGEKPSSCSILLPHLS